MPIVSGNGGSSPVLARNVGQASYDFAQDVNAGAGAVQLTLSFDTGDATLVDLASPTAPQIVTPGVYAFTLTLQNTGGTSAADWSAGLRVDDNYYSVTARTSRALTGDTFGFAAPCVTWWCDANDAFAVLAQLGTGTGSEHFAGQLYVQRVA